MKPAEEAYWQRYLKTLSPAERESLKEAFVYAGCGGSPEITDKLLQLYFAGKKSAGSSLLEDFIAVGDRVPEAGSYWVYLNSKSEPAAILRCDRTERHKFKDVPERIAVAEGEGDLSLAQWRKAHADIWSPHLQAWGVSDIKEATVHTEFFSIVFKEYP